MEIIILSDAIGAYYTEQIILIGLGICLLVFLTGFIIGYFL